MDFGHQIMRNYDNYTGNYIWFQVFKPFNDYNAHRLELKSLLPLQQNIAYHLQSDLIS